MRSGGRNSVTALGFGVMEVAMSGVGGVEQVM
jgi:hypothetical protein